MAYNEKLGERITKLLKTQKGVTEKKMFGGIAYMLKDKMMAGIIKDDIMIRCFHEDYDKLLKKPHAEVMMFTGKPMKGFLTVKAAGIKTDKQLQSWLDVGIDFALNSPPKKKIMKPIEKK